MYEQMRNAVILGLQHLPREQLDEFLRVMDNVASKYVMSKRTLEIAIRVNELPDCAKVYLVVKKMAGLSDNTLANYRILLDVFFREIGKTADQITTNDVRIFLYAYQQRRGISSRTLDAYRADIARFFAWAHNEGYIPSDPCKGLSPIKYEEVPRQALSQIELEYLRRACNSLRDAAIIETFYSTGCRVSELAIMTKEDINWRERTVHIFGKGRKHRTSFINAKAEVALKAYLDSRTDDSNYIFVSERAPIRPLNKDSIEDIVRTISRRAYPNIGRKVTPHILRHTTATTALQRGMPVEDISKLLGHESIETTMIYAKTSLDTVQAGHRKHVV